mgnify:CR=1 FL=1
MVDLPNGTFLARVVRHSFISVGENKTPSLNFQFKVVKNLDTGEPVDETIYSAQWLTDKCYQRTFEMLTKVFGWEGTDVFTDFNADGKECQLVIEAEEYNGTMYPKVKWINAIGGGRKNAQALQKEEMEELRRMFGVAVNKPDRIPKGNIGKNDDLPF